MLDVFAIYACLKVHLSFYVKLMTFIFCVNILLRNMYSVTHLTDLM